MEIRNKDSPIVYICSPYSGDVTHNIEMACRTAGSQSMRAASRSHRTFICRSSYRKRRSMSWV